MACYNTTDEQIKCGFLLRLLARFLLVHDFTLPRLSIEQAQQIRKIRLGELTTG
jgi:hypothetical protein